MHYPEIFQHLPQETPKPSEKRIFEILRFPATDFTKKLPSQQKDPNGADRNDAKEASQHIRDRDTVLMESESHVTVSLMKA